MMGIREAQMIENVLCRIRTIQIPAFRLGDNPLEKCSIFISFGYI